MGAESMSAAEIETIRKLTESDAVQYYSVRLRALREHPEAFGSTAEVFEQSTVSDAANRLRSNASQGFCIFGAFVEEQLVGLCAFGYPLDNPKMSHRGGIYQMYVAPEVRGRKLGLKLLEAAIDHARQLDGVEELVLGVEAGNKPARLLYLRVGFESMYVDPRSLKISGTYYDTEFMCLRLK